VDTRWGLYGGDDETEVRRDRVEEECEEAIFSEWRSVSVVLLLVDAHL
jgi:hypothetical protein